MIPTRTGQHIYFFLWICSNTIFTDDYYDLYYAFKPEHPWLKENGEASDRPIDNVVLSRMKQFRAMNKMKKLALKVWFYLSFFQVF